jgi:hypothetical protein
MEHAKGRCQVSIATGADVGEDFMGRSVAEATAGAMVEQLLHLADAGSRLASQAGSLGKELPNQAVAVFVRAALPGAVGMGKVNVDARPSREFLVLGEFLALVEGRRLAGFTRHAPQRCFHQCQFSRALHFKFDSAV